MAEKKGFDLQKLLAKAKAAAPTASTEHAAELPSAHPTEHPPEHLTEKPAQEPPRAPANGPSAAGAGGFFQAEGPLFTKPASTNAAKTGVGGRSNIGRAGTAGGVAKAAPAGQRGAGLQAPASAAPAKPQALTRAEPVNQKIERQVSQQGLKQDKLDLTQKAERKYPYLALGVDEIYLFAETMFNVARRQLYRVKKGESFSIALKIVGAVRDNFGLTWDGTNFTPYWHAPPPSPSVTVTIDADVVLDNVRGKLSCAVAEFSPATLIEGDVDVLRTLRLKRHSYENQDLLDSIVDEARAGDEVLMRLCREAKDGAEVITRLIERRVDRYVKFIEEPIFIRLTCEETPPVEVLFHFEKGKLTVLRGKPGEKLLAGAAELHLSRVGLAALRDGECNIPFLLITGHLSATGDLRLLRRVGLTNDEIISRVQRFNETKKPPSFENPFEMAIKLTSS